MLWKSIIMQFTSTTVGSYLKKYNFIKIVVKEFCPDPDPKPKQRIYVYSGSEVPNTIPISNNKHILSDCLASLIGRLLWMSSFSMLSSRLVLTPSTTYSPRPSSCTSLQLEQSPNISLGNVICSLLLFRTLLFFSPFYRCQTNVFVPFFLVLNVIKD